MPRTPTYGDSRVRSTAIGGVRRQAAETYASRGGLVGDAQAGFGHELQRAGSSLYDEVLKDEAQRAAAADNLQTLNALNQLDHLMLNSADRGILHKTGMEPMELRGKYLDEYDTQAAEIEKNVKTAAGQSFFAEQLARRRSDFTDRVDTHAASQARQFHAGELQAYLESSTQRAMASFDAADPASPLRVREVLDEQAATIDVNAQYLGIGPEQAAVMKAKGRSDAHVAIISKLIATDRDGDAQHYYDTVADQISEAQKPALMERLKRGSTDATGFAAANELWTQFLPDESNENAAIPIDKMEAAARDRFKNNPEAFKATVAYLRDRRQGVEAGRRDRAAALNGTLWGAAAKGANLAQIRSMPEFKLAPGDLQNKLVDYFENEADRRESRAAARDARALAAENRKDRELEQKGWSTYFELSQPDKLRTMKPGEILAKLPELGHAHVQRLLNDQEQLQKNDDRVRDATIDRDLFKDVMFRAGREYVYESPSKQTDDQKAEQGRLLQVVESEIGRLQQKGGRQLTRDEKEKLFQSIVDRRVMIDAFGVDREAIAAAVTPDDRGRAYLPLAQIPKDTLDRMINVLRGLPDRSGTLKFEVRAPSREDMVRRYKDQLQRAAARAMLGGTDAEIVGILEGKE